ncbi:hypothetical protein LWI29_032090 [Acer saccharum]|uniref:Uncharacterized protein n=1 Tax=Acer saccharum TaxID=4024 RepID=A0AA39SM74_ACESA|nr:hypothetical protein LWI29_032090 [Acer saccharum]
MHTDDLFHYEALGVMPQQGLGRQRDSVQTSHEDTAALPRRDSVPSPQQDSVEASHEDIAALPRRDSVPPPQNDSVEASHVDTTALPSRDSVPPPQQDSAVVHDIETFDQGTAELPCKDTAYMYQLWVSMFGDVKTPPDNQKWSVLTRTWDDEGDLVWANGLRASGCRPWHEVDTVSVLETKMEIRFLISMYLT